MENLLLNCLVILIGIVLAVIAVGILLFLGWAAYVWRMSVIAGKQLPHIIQITKDLSFEEAIQNKDYQKWIRALKGFCNLYVRLFEWVAEYNYVRVNDFLLYRPDTDKEGNKVAKIHIRSKNQSDLHKLMTTKELIDGYIATCIDLVNNKDFDIVLGVTHNRLLSPTIVNKILKPQFSEAGCNIETREMDESYLPWIYCDFLLVYGMNWLETEKGFNTFKRMQTAIEIKVARQ